MKNRCALFALIIAAVPAHADQGKCPSGCNNPPTPVSFSYEDAGKYFNQGTAPTADILLGNWIEVGTAELPGFPDDSVPDAYVPSGINNNDGSPSVELVFSQNKAFDDSVQDTVMILNLGSKGASQGPNEVELNGNGACFAQWGYSTGGAPTQVAHYNYECRLMSGDLNKMVCANIYHVDNASEAGSVPYDGRTVYYVGYIRN